MSPGSVDARRVVIPDHRGSVGWIGAISRPGPSFTSRLGGRVADVTAMVASAPTQARKSTSAAANRVRAEEGFTTIHLSNSLDKRAVSPRR
jgi:hypothetical protein